MVHQA
jgi:hypothetical protein